MKSTHDKNVKAHVNLAAMLNSFFMQAIMAKAKLIAMSQSDMPKRFREGSRLPKGFKKHKPAGTKIARDAHKQTIGIRH